MRAGGRRDLPYSYWPNHNNFFGFAYGITDRYLLSMWDAGSLLSYDDGKRLYMHTYTPWGAVMDDRFTGYHTPTGSERTIPVLCTLRRYPRTDMGGRTNVIDWLQEMDIPGVYTYMYVQGLMSM